MDKELLRSVIIGTGLLIITGLFIWSYIKNQRAELDAEDDYGTEEDLPEEPKSSFF